MSLHNSDSFSVGRKGPFEQSPEAEHWGSQEQMGKQQVQRSQGGAELEGRGQVLLTPASPAASPEAQLSSDLSGYSHHRWPRREREGGLCDNGWAGASLLDFLSITVQDRILKLYKLF